MMRLRRSRVCSSGRGPTRSTAVPTKSNATSSASGSSARRPSRKARKHERAPEQPPSRPAASVAQRPGAAGARSGSMSGYPEGHQLLEGKTVLITAAAGTGIGFATAKRCVEEGARIAISDVHERRLGEAADALAEIGGERPVAVVGDV